MDTKKNQIRDDIQKTMKKYELKLQRKKQNYIVTHLKLKRIYMKNLVD